MFLIILILVDGLWLLTPNDLEQRWGRKKTIAVYLPFVFDYSRL